MKSTISISLLLCLILSACGQKSQDFKNSKWVYDYENILTENQEYVLDSIINNFEKTTKNEIIIITIKETEDSISMLNYAVKMGEKLEVGKANKDNGLVIVFSKNMRETLLATGYGTEKILKDEICKEIIDSFMIPFFKKEDYFGGLKSGLNECIIRWK